MTAFLLFGSLPEGHGVSPRLHRVGESLNLILGQFEGDFPWQEDLCSRHKLVLQLPMAIHAHQLLLPGLYEAYLQGVLRIGLFQGSKTLLAIQAPLVTTGRKLSVWAKHHISVLVVLWGQQSVTRWIDRFEITLRDLCGYDAHSLRTEIVLLAERHRPGCLYFLSGLWCLVIIAATAR